MAKRRRRITQHTVLVEGEYRQLLLFADGLTDLQDALLASADGSRTVAGIAAMLKKGRQKTLQNAKYLVQHGYLRPASAEQIRDAAEEKLAAGKLDDCLQLYISLSEMEPKNAELSLKLGKLYERTAHPYEAADIYEKLADSYIAENKFGDALVMSRKAASLNPGNFITQDKLATLCVQTGRADEAARIWRAYAMRLAGGGAFEKALEIIDSASRHIAGNDTLLYAEAEILALMSKQQKAEDTVDEVADNDNKVIALYENGAKVGVDKEIESVAELEEGVFEGATVEVESAAELEEGVAEGATVEVESAAELEEGDAEGATVEVESAAELEEGDAEGATVEVESAAELEEGGSEGATVEVESAAELEEGGSEEVTEEIDFDALSSKRTNRDNIAQRKYRDRGRGLLSFLLTVVVILVLAAAGNYYYRHKMHRAVVEVQGLNSLINESTLFEKINISRGAFALLNTSRPPLDFMYSNEYRDQLVRTELMLRKSEKEFEENNLEFIAYRKVWENKPEEKLALRFAAYMDDEGISLHHRQQARVLYKKWLQQSKQRARDLRDAIDVLSGNKYTPEERFAAYRKILEEFPAALTENYPAGVRDLTVPVIIKAEIAGSGRDVPVQFSGAVKKKNGFVEVPVDGDRKSYVLYPGYGLAADSRNKGKSEIVYPLTFKQLYVLNKMPWREFVVKFGFEPLQQYVVEQLSCILLADRDHLALVDLFNGKVLEQKKLVAAPLNSGVNFELDGLEQYFSVLSDGALTVGSVVSEEGEKKLAFTDEVKSFSALTAELVDLELGENSGVNVVYSNYFNSVKAAALSLYNLGSLTDSWSAEVKQSLAENIASPVIKIAKIDWHFVLVCKNGEVVVLLENGEIYKRFELESATASSLHSNDVEFAASITGVDYLVCGGKVYRLDISQEDELLELWKIPRAAGADYLVTSDGVILYGDGSLDLLALSNGQGIYRHEYKGELADKPLIFDNNIIIAVEDRVQHKYKISALDYSKNKNSLSWDNEFYSRVVYLSTGRYNGKEELFVYTADGKMHVFR